MEQPPYTKSEAQRGLGLQVAIAFAIGSSSLLLFSYSRRKWPQMYGARLYRNTELPELDDSLLGWIPQLIRFRGEDVLRFAGLDAYVYLSFFRLAIAILVRLSLVALFFIAPLRMYNWFEGNDDDETPSVADDNNPQTFDGHSWVFLATTYIFTTICLLTMRQYNTKIVSVRQAYLGHQNSITDRTLRLSGIPKKLRSEEELMKYVKTLFGVEPESVILCRKWDNLEQLFNKRKALIAKLEEIWTDYIGPDHSVFRMGNPDSEVVLTDVDSHPPPSPLVEQYQDDDSETEDARNSSNGGSSNERANASTGDLDSVSDLPSICARLFPDCRRPVGRIRMWGMAGPKVDLLDHYGQQLTELDQKIIQQRQLSDSQPSTNMAFITMKSVAHCQLAAQCLFSPRPHTMVNSLAPAPNDIIWRNVYLHSKQRSFYNYVISLVVLITNVFLFYPLNYLARLLNLGYISEHIPWLGKWLSQHKWMTALVTDVLPTYLLPSFNLVIPYFFAWLTIQQGMVSRSEAQLSTISKNFFYMFVNFFLVFTIENTFLSLSVDKLAKDFAQLLMRLSSFYTNLIILQGIGLTTLKLLQTGALFQFPFLLTKCNTAREHYNLYKPQKLNYGLFLPMPMLFFIITLTYSILSLRILFFGLIYFAANYFVFKYQLLYAMVYHHHSNAQLWAIIIRRMYLGIAIFHLAMAGVLVWRSKYTFAAMIVPLSVALCGFWYDFERFTKPLLEFVAVEALRQKDIDAQHLGTYNIVDGNSSLNAEDTGVGTQDTRSPADLRTADLPSVLWGESTLGECGDGPNTLDEIREENQEYINKVLSEPLDGPWVAASAFECVVANPDGFQRRSIPQTEWL